MTIFRIAVKCVNVKNDFRPSWIKFLQVLLLSEISITPINLSGSNDIHEPNLHTECVMGLDKQLSLVKLGYGWWFGFRHETIFAAAPAASKMTLASKVIICKSKINILPWHMKEGLEMQKSLELKNILKY